MKYKTFYQLRYWTTLAFLVLSFTTIFGILAFCDPRNLPGGLVWPCPTEVPTAWDVFSNRIAYSLYMSFGYGVWFLMFAFGRGIFRFMVRDEPRQSSWRFFGFCVVLTGICTLLQLFFSPGFFNYAEAENSIQYSTFVIYGHGGILGATGTACFGVLGTWCGLIFSAILIFVGTFLYSDFVFSRILRWLAEFMNPRTQRATLGWLRFFLREKSGWNRHLDGVDEMGFSQEAPEIITDCDVSIQLPDKPLAPQEHQTEPEPALNLSLEQLGFPIHLPESKSPAGTSADTPQNQAPAKTPQNQAPAGASITIHKPEIVLPSGSTDFVETSNASGDPELQEAEVGKAVQEQMSELEPEYVFPTFDLLEPAEEFDYSAFEDEVRDRAQFLEEVIKEYGFSVKVKEVQLGPVLTQYQVEPEAGLRVGKISNLADDLAVKLGVSNVRIVFPIIGKKNLIGIEIPNVKKKLVRMREVMEELEGTYDKMDIPIFLGKDVAGKSLATDLASLPHLLIAGRTGTGKSVCLNSIILSILMTRSPKEVRLLMIDPKMVELSQYQTIPHLMHPVVTDMKKAEALLAWAVEKMEERYRWLARVGVRHLNVYNAMTHETKVARAKPLAGETMPEHMPFIVIIADEMADLIMTAPKEVESHIIRLAQKSRAVGIHLILATQKPIVSVITTLIKSNLPAKIAFQVSTRMDSRVVLDENGAERLLGHGDMLFLAPGTGNVTRAQGTYLTDDEINRVVSSISTGESNFATETIDLGASTGGTLDDFAKRDELYISAIDIIVHEKRGSITLLQRMLGIGYGRAARLIDYMEEDKIVGTFCGYTKPREVLLSVEDWEAMSEKGGGGSGVAEDTEYTEDMEDAENTEDADDYTISEEPEDSEDSEELDDSDESEPWDSDDTTVPADLPVRTVKRERGKDRRKTPPNIQKLWGTRAENEEVLNNIQQNQPEPFVPEKKDVSVRRGKKG